MKKQTIIMQIESEQSGKVTLSVSDYIGKATLHSICQLCKEKHKGEIKVDLSAPYKSRTTGKGSQNNLFWELCTLIAEEIGDDISSVEADLKMKAISKGYPYKVSKITGKPSPVSTTQVNTVEMSYLIDTAQEVCAFLGIGQEKNEVDIF